METYLNMFESFPIERELNQQMQLIFLVQIEIQLQVSHNIFCVEKSISCIGRTWHGHEGLELCNSICFHLA